MSQRLGIAAAVLGDPPILLLDEPANGLDTEGIRWLRRFLRAQAEQRRTVLLSSHVMSEMELVADHLLVIGAGRLLADEPMPEFIARHSSATVRVHCDDNHRLATALEHLAVPVQRDGTGLLVRDLPSRRIGAVAAEVGVIIAELTELRPSLEDVYTDMVTPHGRYRQHDVEEVA